VDKQTNKCKGYGFVDFRKQEDAKTALGELKKEQKDVQLAKQREQDPTNLYFANLPSDIDEQCLNDMLKAKFDATVNSTR
jgi:RNA recognition motif-containing protein